MIERFDPKYRWILNIPEHIDRWNQIREVDKNDHDSFRVLFGLETAATMEWIEPTPERLSQFLDFILDGGLLAIRDGDVIDLIQAVWPLQLAKREVQKMRLIWEPDEWKKYPLGSISLPIVACVTTWWAFETLVNDIVSILAEERSSTSPETIRLLIDEKIPTINGKGHVIERNSYQPIEERVQFVFNFATGEILEKNTETWRSILALKRARDVTIHRIGKPKSSEFAISRLYDTVIQGLAGISTIIKRIFLETPEFQERHVYNYLAYWACEVQEPVFWDGQEGQGWYFGPAKPQTNCVLSSIAPEPAFITHREKIKVNKKAHLPKPK